MLSDKDPMLGSASNQFCLPVVDSNEPNFQMPCSTVVGLDDIMDEGVVKESVNDTIDEEELILPSRNLRDKVEENSVRSPRKSPRLMAQEQVRSLRQSTIAKRASAAPAASTKKASGKPSPRAAARPAEAGGEAERHRESRRGGRHAGQRAAAPGVAVPPACVEVKERAEPGGAQHLNGGALAGSPEPGADPLFSFSEQEDRGRDVSASGQVPEAAVGEMGETGHAEPASGDPGRAPHEEPPELEAPAPSGTRSARAACPVPREREQRTAGFSPSPDGAATEAAGVDREAGGYCRDPESSGQQPEDAGFSEAALEPVDAEALELEGGALGDARGDGPDQRAEQFSAAGSVATQAPEAAGLPDDRSSHFHAVPSAEPKSTRARPAGPAADPQPAPAAEQPQKRAAAKQEPGHHRSRAHARSGKRTGGELDAQLGLHRSAKVRKKQVDKDTKTQPWNPAARSAKGQAHPLPKKAPQDQSLVPMSKPLAAPLNDKSLGPPGSSREPPNSAHTGPAPHQKASRPPPAAAVRANSQAKEELEHAPGEHAREDDKLKPKKPERHLQPRQRRSSKNFSVDEPPLFIPDNVATVKREGSDHSAPFESKYVWTPSKQCGFCKKPHGNRFMVGCGRCDDWFHGDCVGLSLTQAQQMGEEDKEYVCVRCCAEEDKKTELADGDVVENQANPEVHSEEKTMDCEKLGLFRHTPASEKTKSLEEPAKHKAKALRRESVEGKNSSDGREGEVRRWRLAPLRKTGPTVVPRRASEERSERGPKEPAAAPGTGDRAARTGAHEKQEAKKKRVEKGVPSAPPAAAKPSADQIRQSVRQSLKDTLMKRLADSNLKMPEEKATKVATKIEKELFSFFRDTDAKYKNKYRSLMFNLKDPKNSMLFKKVLKGEVTPDHLIKMSPEELASKELAAWRRRENRHTIEMIEKEQREAERRPITKITHKGEIEIESDAPMKEQEVPMESQEAAANKSLEKAEGCEKQESDSTSKDSTSQHRQHLFDLNCKICIGRMAPPADDLSPKKVKVAVGVTRKHSDNEADSIADALSAASTMLTPELFEEEKQDSPKSTFSPAPRPEMPGTVEVESTFLARLNFIWKGFINMPSVAKVVTKAYPVSGSPEYLTEDLPDSIQVGGRISPQTVWDYVEKIKASGTKDICVVRFTPVTEEDQISYTLLFAYFSSRRRYGVAANNMKQVKDMYLIPLGAADKIPHPLVPFDGPGLELHRPNLLLGLIIRQKLKRPHGAGHVADTPDGGPAALPPEKRSKLEAAAPEEESDFFNSLTAVLHKQRNKPAPGPQEELPAAGEPLLEAARQEPPKPLRFLPGVLIGWESQPAALDLAHKPLPVDDILQSLLGAGQGPAQPPPGPEPGARTEIPFLSPDAEKADGASVPDGESPDGAGAAAPLPEAAGNPAGAGEEPAAAPGALAGLSLRGKPPDVSTEAFLTTLTVRSTQEDAGGKDTPCRGALPPEPETAPQEPADGSEAPGAPRAPPFINLKRDPRQAAGRSQPAAGPDGRDGDAAGREEDKGSPPDTAPEPRAPEEQGPADPQSVDPARAPDAPSADDGPAAAPAPQDGAVQTIETVSPFRRGAALEAGGEFPPRGTNFAPRSTSPRAGGVFPRPPGLPPLKAAGFPFPGFPPPLPPPLLPPPAFGFAPGSVLPWPPVVHLPGPPPRVLAPRYLGPQSFYPLRDARRPERRHSEPWAERPFSRGPGDRPRGHSDAQRPKREPERHQRRERSQDRERKRDDGHKDRARPAHGDRGAEGKAGHKKPDKPSSDEHEREKNKDRDRPHSDRAKSKR